jgi:hypothetical protein
MPSMISARLSPGPVGGGDVIKRQNRGRRGGSGRTGGPGTTCGCKACGMGKNRLHIALLTISPSYMTRTGSTGRATTPRAWK